MSGESLLALPPLPEKRVEEWVWDGLVSRKDLAAGDQTLELRRAQVIEALAGFLPNVVLGGGGLSGSIEDVAIRGWAGSLVGTWAVFEGFRTVQQYRAAKATRETEFKLQEERMTAVVIAVADRKYIADKGMDTIRRHAEDFIRTRLAPANPPNDGKQTPMRGHPVFKAQHATATCCRGCLCKWWRIPKGTAIPPERQSRIVDFLMEWIGRQLDRP